jgi:hypothetical protein
MHHGGTADSNSCVLCLFANGHVDLPQTVPAVTAPVRWVLEAAPPARAIVTVDFTYLVSPSRAPPAPAFVPSVVA